MGKLSVDKKFLRTLSPLSGLSADRLDELASKSELEKWPAGRLLFRKGDDDRRLLYLLEGEVELVADNTTRVLAAGSAEATAPVSKLQPHRFTARAKTAVKVLVIDRDLFDLLNNDMGTAPGGYEVTELDCGPQEDDEWMIRFLQSSAFAKLPAETIQAILARLQPLDVAAGSVVVRQGDDDPYYYIISAGQCRVTRRPAPGLPDIRLAELSAGDGFGEEALITRATRNATVTMLEDGTVMRLGKEDFQRMLVAPLVRTVSATAAKALLAGDAALLDVRNPDEFARGKLDSAINLPLSTLRLKLKGLPPVRDYVVYCEDGHRSTAAVFLMRQQGLRAHVLEGGIGALAGKAKQAVPAAPPARRPAPVAGKPTVATPPAERAQAPRAAVHTQQTRAARPASANGQGQGTSQTARRAVDLRLSAEIEAARRAAELEARRKPTAAPTRSAAPVAARSDAAPQSESGLKPAAPGTVRSGLEIDVGEMIREPARLRSVGSKTVLEAEEDIFVFQAPPPGITTEPMPKKKAAPVTLAQQPLSLLPIDSAPRKGRSHSPRPAPVRRRARTKALAAMLVLGVGAGILSMYDSGAGDTRSTLATAEEAGAAHRIGGIGGGADAQESWFADLKAWFGFTPDAAEPTKR